MTDAEDFRLAGHYRVQSRRTTSYSELGGTWYTDSALLESATVNAALAQHPAWRGHARVNLRAAKIAHRTGNFLSEPDILYKREFFRGDGMDCDVVDVEKSKGEWAARRGALSAVFGPTLLAAIDARLGNLDSIIANEYYVHEAGHFLGVDVLEKYATGYFTSGGRTLWPLIYAEELRADLGGYDFALRLLPASQAEGIFLYNLALRFGAHRKGIEQEGIEVYGLVPYLLFCVLHELGFLTIEGGRIHVASLEPARLHSAMVAAATYAHEQFTAPEMAAATATDRAIHVATFVRKCLDDRERRKIFASLEGGHGR